MKEIHMLKTRNARRGLFITREMKSKLEHREVVTCERSLDYAQSMQDRISLLEEIARLKIMLKLA
jgi:hypothetical protein